MKRICIAVMLKVLLCVAVLHAQTKQTLNIEAATVFLSGAELQSTASLKLARGENEVLFTNVAGNVNSQSLNISTTNEVVVLSATFQNNYLAEEVSTVRVKTIKDSIELLQQSQEDINTKISSIDEAMVVINENRRVGGDNSGLSVAEMTKMLDLVDTRWEAYVAQKKKQETLRAKISERINALNRQLNEEQQKGNQPRGQLAVKFYATDATATDVSITYVVPNAGWRPMYDIWAGGASGPIKLFYKANIFQNTGVKWTNVKLTLSTGDPNETAQAPAVSPWHIALYQPAIAMQSTTITAYKVPLVNHDTRSTVLVKDQIQAMPTMQVADIVSTSASVYQAQRGANVQIGGARTEGTEYIVDGVVVQGNAPSQASINNYVAVDNSSVNTTFDIDLPYTIPSDGQQHLVAIKEYMLPATYRYYAVPKLDKDVFLQAQVTRWEDLDLLPGITRIYHEGTYIGQGVLDVRNVKDTMYISLGRDKKIVVKRELDTKMHTKKVIGANEHEAFGYNISVRNTRKEPVNLVLLDQVPISNDGNVVVEDVETGDAQQDEKTGILTWNIPLGPGEAHVIDFGFSVKYPKGKAVEGLR